MDRLRDNLWSALSENREQGLRNKYQGFEPYRKDNLVLDLPLPCPTLRLRQLIKSVSQEGEYQGTVDDRPTTVLVKTFLINLNSLEL